MTASSRLSIATGAALASFSALGLFPTTLPAQQGSYSAFGKGCGPAIPVTGISYNMSCTSLQGSKSFGKTWFAMPGLESVARVITGASFRTMGLGVQTTTIELWLADRSYRPSIRLRTGTLRIGKTLGTWSGKFSSSYKMPANTRYVVAITFPKGSSLPLCRTGTYTMGSYRNNSTLPWVSIKQPWAYQVDYAPTIKAPTLQGDAEPAIGHTMKVSIANARPRSFAWLAFGGSNTSWGALRLPFSLSGFQAPGCFLETSQAFSLVAPTDTTGTATIAIPMPNSPSLIGKRFYNQGIVFDKTANKLGLAFTNGRGGLVGKPCVPGRASSASAPLRITLPSVSPFGFPGMKVSGRHSGIKRKRCCSLTGPQACYYSGKGSLSGQVAPFAIPSRLLGKVANDINFQIAQLLSRAAASRVTASTRLAITINGIQLKASLGAIRDECNRTTSYTSTGQVLFAKGTLAGTDTSTSVRLPLLGTRRWQFKLRTIAIPEGTWQISKTLATMSIKIKSVTVTGKTVIPGINRTVNFNLKILTPTLTLTTPAVSLPAIPIGC